MNVNLCVECDECSRRTNCRLGMSNRDVQPLKFSCKGCGSLIGLNFTVKDPNSLDNRVIEAMLALKSPREMRAGQGIRHTVTGGKEVHIERGFDTALDLLICTSISRLSLVTTSWVARRTWRRWGEQGRRKPNFIAFACS